MGVNDNLVRNSRRTEEAEAQLSALEQNKGILESERESAQEALNTAESEIEKFRASAASDENFAETNFEAIVIEGGEKTLGCAARPRGK